MIGAIGSKHAVSRFPNRSCDIGHSEGTYLAVCRLTSFGHRHQLPSLVELRSNRLNLRFQLVLAGLLVDCFWSDEETVNQQVSLADLASGRSVPVPYLTTATDWRCHCPNSVSHGVGEKILRTTMTFVQDRGCDENSIRSKSKYCILTLGFKRWKPLLIEYNRIPTI